jgi:hypothetical protein
MGFHRRYINKKIIYNSIEKNNFKNLFIYSDAFIFEDKISSYAYELFLQGENETEILKKLNNYEDNQIN